MRVRSGVLLAGALLAGFGGPGALGRAAGATGTTVTITSPTSGAVLDGTVHVEIAAAGVSGDPPSSLSLAVTNAGVTTDVGSSPCASGGLTCVGAISWDTTGLSGQMSLAALVTTASGQTTTSTPITVTIKSPPPTATIMSPASGAVVKGTVTVDVAGSTDPSQSDSPSALALFDTTAGATTEIATTTCPTASPAPSSCVGELTWNTTGLSGTQVLTAEVTTANGLTATSPAVTVTVESPQPTVAITSPVAGAILSGVVNVDITGATDPSVSDYPTDLALYATSGNATTEVGDYACLANAINASPRCSGPVSWDTTTASGPQTLTAVITTNDGRSETSVPLRVTVWSRARLDLAAPPTVHAGNRTAVRGTVVSANDGVPLAGVLVRLTVAPASGAAHTVTARTNAHGAFAFGMRAATNATDRLVVPDAPSVGGTSALTHQLVLAPARCSLATLRLRAGLSDAGSCRVGGLPAAVPVVVAAHLKGAWHALTSVASRAGALSFTVRLPAGTPPGRYPLEVQIAASRPYAATTASLGTLVAS